MLAASGAVMAASGAETGGAALAAGTDALPDVLPRRSASVSGVPGSTVSAVVSITWN